MHTRRSEELKPPAVKTKNEFGKLLPKPLVFRHRPVLRLSQALVFTQVEPPNPLTYMVMMIRPGWQQYWSSLTGLEWPASGRLPVLEGDRCATGA